jgi:hypothetical protein
MNTKRFIIATIWILTFCSAYGQKDKSACYFDTPIVVDSLSTIIIPTRYSVGLFSSNNKIALWGDYYANIIFYNFITDSYKQLFEKDTYIVGFSRNYYYNTHLRNEPPKNTTLQQIFYMVKNFDRNKNGRIDEYDPAILYVSDLYGNNLKPLTSENENVINFEIFEKQNLVFIKIQRDQDNNGKFNDDDKDFYFIKLDLTTMTFGNKIELK